jgi:hypothetical protein
MFSGNNKNDDGSPNKRDRTYSTDSNNSNNGKEGNHIIIICTAQRI